MGVFFMKKPLVVLIISILIVFGIALTWYLVSPLFINKTVNEEFPFDLPKESEITQLSPIEAEEIVDSALEVIDAEFVENLSPEEASELESQVLAVATMMPDNEIEEEMPDKVSEIEWVSILSGNFRGSDNFHQGNGIASIFQQGDQLVLRFEEFKVTNGPDLHVYLVQNINGTNQSELGNYLDLGSLKGNMGNQNYEIPVDTDLSQYQGVMIYCEPFHVVFATAQFGS
mgnify:CR=1 FL=1|jgi:hypothetical protein